MLPQTVDAERVAKQIRHVPMADRDDAIQVAWLAHLEARDPSKAVDAWRRRELRTRARERTNSRGH